MIDDLLSGKPQLKFIVWRDETNLGEFTFDPHEFELTPSLSPVFIEHVLQDESIDQKVKGYRYNGTLNFEVVKGTLINKLSKLFTKLNSGANYYNRIQFYPSRVDLPGWSFDVVIKGDDIITGFLNIIAHKDIQVSFKSKILQDHIPLAQSSFLTWGNMQLQFTDLDMLFNTLT